MRTQWLNRRDFGGYDAGRGARRVPKPPREGEAQTQAEGGHSCRKVLVVTRRIERGSPIQAEAGSGVKSAQRTIE